MLVETTNYTDSVVTMKLITGEEILARVVTHLGATITIKNPLAMVMVPDDSGNQGMVAFAPWVLGAEENVPLAIDLKNVLLLTKARSDAASQYASAVGEETVMAKTTEISSGVGRRGGRGR